MIDKDKSAFVGLLLEWTPSFGCIFEAFNGICAFVWTSEILNSSRSFILLKLSWNMYVVYDGVGTIKLPQQCFNHQKNIVNKALKWILSNYLKVNFIFTVTRKINKWNSNNNLELDNTFFQLISKSSSAWDFALTWQCYTWLGLPM